MTQSSFAPSTSPDQPHLVVLLHFLGGSVRAWDRVVDALPAGFGALRIDLPGFGDARSATTGYDVASMVDHVAALVADRVSRAPAVTGVTLIGHSMGAKVATVLARHLEDGQHPTIPALAGLVLVAGSPPSPEPMEETKRATMLGWFAGDEASRHDDAAGYLSDNVASPLADALQSQGVADVLRTHPDAWSAWLREGSREDWADRVGVLRTPALIVAGAKDEALGTASQRRWTAQHFDDLQVVTVGGTGHLIPLEAPALLAGLIAQHAGRAAAPAPLAIEARYLAFLHSPRVSAGTRDALLARDVPKAALDRPCLPGDLKPTLQALLARVVPQPANRAIDLATRIDRMLGDPQSDGWRFAALPPDLQAWTAGLRTLDHAADGAFAGLADAAQDVLLEKIAAGRLKTPSDPARLDADGMRLWFEDVRSAATRTYLSHPATLARIGYSGVANGGDGERLLAWTAIGEGEEAPWEPQAETRR